MHSSANWLSSRTLHIPCSCCSGILLQSKFHFCVFEMFMLELNVRSSLWVLVAGMLKVSGVFPSSNKLWDTPGVKHTYQLSSKLNSDEVPLYMA